MGCSRCLKQFPGPFGGRNYGGFDRENWTIRTNDQHRLEMQEINTCSSIGDKNELESKLGTRYSVLGPSLPYYDSIRMSVIDPMHNLFQGNFICSIKRNICIW